MSSSYLAIISKIIFFYSLFYVVMKIVAAFGGNMPYANLILAIPYLAFSIIGGLMLKNNKYHWAYAIVGIIMISALRFYEQEWMLAIEGYFN